MPDTSPPDTSSRFDEVTSMIDMADSASLASFVGLLDEEEKAFLYRHLDRPHQEALLKLLPASELGDILERLLGHEEPEHVESFVEALPPTETAYVVSRLDDDDQSRLLQQLPPNDAADLLEHFIDEHAADLIEELPTSNAAAIFDQMDSDDQADVLYELDDEDAEAILREMDPQEAEDVRRLVQYGQDVAGGLMITEYLAYRDDQTIEDVLADLRENVAAYQEYPIDYIYVVDHEQVLRGLVNFREIVMRPRTTGLGQVMRRDVDTVGVHDSIDDLEDFFDAHNYYSVPVIDEEGRLVGVVRRAAVEAELGERADKALLKVGGIIAGEELRTMPLYSRSARRLVFLTPNMFLFMVSVSIIAMFEGLIEKVPVLAAFLPVVAGMSGSSGNQAMAVSIRELSLDLVRPADVLRVALKEVAVGAVNGLAIGLLLVVLAWALRGNMALGAIIGASFAIASVLSVVVGGVVPLVLKAMKVDPAMAAGPLVTTIADISAFVIMLTIAALAVAHLT